MKGDKWESDSLKWIHEVREKMWQEVTKIGLKESAERTNKNAHRLIQEWGLHAIYPEMEPKRKQA